jgi:Carbohydrate binding domain
MITKLLHRPRVAAMRADDIFPLALSAAGVVFLAEVGRDLPLRATTLALTIACACVRPVLGAALILVAANDPSLFRGHAFGSLACVDLLIAVVVARAALAASRQKPSWLEASSLGFLAAGALGTLMAHSGSAPTAFARVASYVILGLVVGRALAPGDRPLLTRVFVGTQAGQALAALATITSTTATGFPIGRYLGTLGDPAQFGIPIAFAAVLLGVSHNVVRQRAVRGTLLALLVAAVAGSATRSAWAVAGVGGLLAIAHGIGSGRRVPARAAVALTVLAAVVAGTVVVVIGARTIGLNPDSAALRRHSIDVASAYLARHPLSPLGLGNNPRLESLAAAPHTPNLVPDSSFEAQNLGWLPFRGAELQRSRVDKVSGDASLRVVTAGRRVEEGVTTSAPLAGLRGSTTYTFSIYGKAPIGTPLWLYVDEYDQGGRWLTYSYSKVTTAGGWVRLTHTWRTDRRTSDARLFVVTGKKIKTAFSLDTAQLEPGTTAGPYIAGPPRPITQASGTYNTWLAVAISLGIAAAVFLAVLAAGAPYHAHRLGNDAVAIALVAILVPSLTENFVYAESFVTLLWLAALGLTVTAQASVANDSR